MSLVNKMLRDLDARRAGDAERGVLPTAVTSPGAEVRVPRSRMAALLVLAVLAAGGVAAYFNFLPTMGPPLPPPVTMAVPPMPSAPVPAPVDTPAAESIPAPAPMLAPLAAKPAPAPVVATSALTPLLPDVVNSSLKLDASLTILPSAAPVRPAAAKPAAAKPSALAAPVPVPAPAPPPAKAAPPAVDFARPATAAAEGQIEKLDRQTTAAEKAEVEYRRGQIAQRQGAADEAAARYRVALVEQPEHAAARQTLTGLLIERRRFDEAEDVLRGGRTLFPLQSYWPMTLARLKVERGEAAAALDILQKQAAAGEKSADYQGFHGALLQRFGRAAEAAERYAAATRLAPNEARWWAGMGIALEGAGRVAEARSAYERARSLPGLPPDLAAHVEQRLRAR